MYSIMITRCKSCTPDCYHRGPGIFPPKKDMFLFYNLFYSKCSFYLENIGNKIYLVISSDLTLLHFAAQTAGWSTESAGNKIVFIHFKNLSI